MYVSLLNRWIQKIANLVFPLYPELVLDVGMKQCTQASKGTKGKFSYCRYNEGGLHDDVFDALCSIDPNDDD